MMILLKRMAAVFLISAFAAGSAFASAVYDYSYMFGDGTLVTGSFTGTASGNLVTGLSGISAEINGTPFVASGSLFGSTYFTGTGYVSGGAVASFDGTANNFFFSDVDFPTSSSFTEVFQFLTSPDCGGGNVNCAEIYVISQSIFGGDVPADVGRWTLAEASSVPEPASLALFGVALLGVFGTRRAKNHVISKLQ